MKDIIPRASLQINQNFSFFFFEPFGGGANLIFFDWRLVTPVTSPPQSHLMSFACTVLKDVSCNGSLM